MTEEFYEDEAGREIFESIPDFPVCAYEGCNELVQSLRPWHSLYCSPECEWKGWQKEHPGYMKEYDKARRQTPKRKAYEKALSQTPKAKARQKAKRQTPKRKEYMKEYRQSPAGKASEAKSQKKYRARKKAERLAAEEQTSP